MAKNFEAMYKEHFERSQEYLNHGGYRIAIPDFTTEKVSQWTYADMKWEFAESIKLFSENGFSDEAVSMAERCVRLSRFNDISQTFTMTENAMLFTVFLSEAYKANDLLSVHKWKEFFGKRIDMWRSAPKHGLVLSPEEQAELDRDIENVREMIRMDNSEAPLDEKIGFYPEDEPGFDDACRSVLKQNSTAESTKIMRQRLSAEAYEMMTEYERERTFTDPDDFEKKVLLPKGLRMTEKLREFIEIYDGRVFAWGSTDFFEMDVPFSHHNFSGFSISFGGNICLNRGKYYISTMDYHYAGDWGPHIDEDGKIYEYICGSLELMANSIEEFLESQSRERLKSKLLLTRRRELENKYLIPAIRTASM